MVSLDIYGIKNDIHPSNKQGFGTRLAQTALGMVYGQDIPWQSPEYDRISVEGNALTVHFRHTGTGIKSTFADSETGKDVREFLLAGSDKVFHPATAVITSENTVVVTSDQVQEPQAVRYAWRKSPHVDLVGDGNLPVSPFRSDDWELWPIDSANH